MRRETEVGLGIGLGLLALELSRWAFTKSARKEIGKRDGWVCQGTGGEPCLWYKIRGTPARFVDGYMVTAAHYPWHHKADDPNPEHGRILCIADHALEELGRGNQWGAEKLLGMGIYHRNHVRETGKPQWYPTLDELWELVGRAEKAKNRIGYVNKNDPLSTG